MKELQELDEIEQEINEVAKKLDPDFNYLSFTKHTSLILRILRDIFQDNNDWIEYFIYERSFGKDCKLGDVTDKKGKPIPFQTAGDVYDMLIKNLKSKEKK